MARGRQHIRLSVTCHVRCGRPLGESKGPSRLGRAFSQPQRQHMMSNELGFVQAEHLGRSLPMLSTPPKDGPLSWSVRPRHGSCRAAVVAAVCRAGWTHLAVGIGPRVEESRAGPGSSDHLIEGGTRCGMEWRMPPRSHCRVSSSMVGRHGLRERAACQGRRPTAGRPRDTTAGSEPRGSETSQWPSKPRQAGTDGVISEKVLRLVFCRPSIKGGSQGAD